MGDYGAPLFLAWQLTNRCTCSCLHCCEESGPDKGWPDELSKEEALKLARDVASCGIPYSAFGGGEPLGVPHVWEIFDILRAGRVGLKIETNGLPIDDRAADKLAELQAECVQISVDGASIAAHEQVRPKGDFRGAVAALERLSKRGIAPEVVFVPTRYNLKDAEAVFELAVRTGSRAFVSGPMMRLGRAAQAWSEVAPTEDEWRACAARLEVLAAKHPQVKLCLYPWGIQEEIRVRRDGPQAMMLVVPNGKVKLLNALPWACADLRKVTVMEAWALYKRAWKAPEVLDFTARAVKDPALLAHANECWDIPSLAPAGAR